MKFDGTFGENFSGSLGGITASKNKGGQYLKAKPIPTNPKTIAQVKARAFFSSASGGFRARNALEFAQWNEFAINLYIPKNAKAGSVPTGFQAYTALNNQIFNAFNRLRTFVLQVDNIDPIGGNTFAVFGPSTNFPPTTAVVPQMSDTGDIELAMIPIAAEVDIEGKCRFEWQLGTGVSISIDEVAFPSNEGMAFAMFMSDGNSAKGRSHRSVERYLLGYFENPILTAPADYSSFSTLRINATDTLDISEFNTFPLVGEWVIITLYAVGKNGNMVKVGALEVQMSGGIV